MDKYSGMDNHGKPRADYLKKIAEMDMDSLKKETTDKIWLSAYANNNPKSDYHWHVDACYDEIMAREGSVRIYTECWEKAKASY